MKLVEQVCNQGVATDDGQKAHAASANALEGRSVILDQLGRGSCTSAHVFRGHASVRDYWDTWKHGEAEHAALQGSCEVSRVRGAEDPQSAER